MLLFVRLCRAPLFGYDLMREKVLRRTPLNRHALRRIKRRSFGEGCWNTASTGLPVGCSMGLIEAAGLRETSAPLMQAITDECKILHSTGREAGPSADRGDILPAFCV